jgi:cystathionine beta-lyase/cystathionine gamma-synthase
MAKDAPKLVFFETPANPNLRIIDIAAIGRMARQSRGLIDRIHELALRQMTAFGGLIACELRGGKKSRDGLHGSLRPGDARCKLG